MKITGVAIIVLALGIALGLAFRGTVFEAEATKPFPEEGKHYQLERNRDLPDAPITWGPFDIGGCTKLALFVDLDPTSDSERYELMVGAHGAWNRLTPDYVAEGYYPGGRTRYERYDNVVAPLAAVHLDPQDHNERVSLDLYCLP